MRVGPFFLTLLMRSLRISVRMPATDGAPRVLVFWHGGMLVPWYLFRRGRAAALVSASRDGDVLAAVLHAWGITVVRGSSSAGGSEAVRAMVDLVRRGYSVLITPDGPRGPAEQMKIGAFVVAQRTGAPIMLCAPQYRNAWRLRSWDRFFIPKPFSRVDVQWRGPIAIAQDCIGEALDMRRAQAQRELQEMHAHA